MNSKNNVLQRWQDNDNNLNYYKQTLLYLFSIVVIPSPYYTSMFWQYIQRSHREGPSNFDFRNKMLNYQIYFHFSFVL